MNVDEIVRESAAHVFGRPVTNEDTFFALGGDSLLAAELAIVIERHLDMEVDPETILHASSFGQLADTLAKQLAAG